LFCQSAQRRLRRLLDIRFFRRCCTQGDSKARKSTQEPCAGFRRTPTDARIETAIAMRVLDGQRGLTYAAHALYGSASNRRLRHGSGFVLH
jgi:hypothetical protein